MFHIRLRFSGVTSLCHLVGWSADTWGLVVGAGVFYYHDSPFRKLFVGARLIEVV